MSRRYFGGSSATDGKQHQLKATSFKELVESFFNVPRNMQVTRQEFHNSDKHTQDKLKNGAFFTACTFKPGSTERNNKNADSLALIALDFDFPSPKDKKEGFLDYASAFVESPESLAEMLHPFNFVAYQTASSTKKQPRCRVVVSITESDISLHKRFVHHVAKQLGVKVNLWKGAIESRTLSLPMFRPVQFIDEDVSPILWSRTDGQDLDEFDLSPEEEAEDTRFAYEGAAPTGEDFLLYLPLNDLEVSDIVEPLNAIDPDCGYFEWIKIATALRHQFRSEEEAENAYFEFDDWSSRGSKYQGSEDTLAKWQSFRPDIPGRTPVTIASLFDFAIKAGWNSAEVTTKVKQGISEWIASCGDADVLMAEGTKRIAALPFKNEVVEEALSVQLREAIKALSKVSIDKATIKKAVKDSRRDNRREESHGLPAWLRPWVFISTDNEFYSTRTGLRLSPAAFNNTYSAELYSEQEDGGSGKPPIAPVDFALNIKQIRRVEGTIYDPRRDGEEPFFEENHISYVNLYRSNTTPKLDAKNAKKAGSIFTKHLRMFIGDPETEKTLLDYIARIVQAPGELTRWAPVIQSVEGAGKSMMVDAITAVVGQPNVKIVSQRALNSDFNDYMVGSQVAVIEEVWMRGEGSMAKQDSLKEWITNDRISLSAKFQAITVGLNTSAKFFFTNHVDALRLNENDRRYMPIKSCIQTRAQAEALAAAGAFKPLRKVIDKFPGALRHFFLNYEISEDFPVNGPAPKTAFRAELIEESKDELQKEIESIIENENIPAVGSDVICMASLTGSLAMATFRSFQKPTHILRQMGYVPYCDGQRFSFGGLRTRLWVHQDNYDEDMGNAEELILERMDFEDE